LWLQFGRVIEILGELFACWVALETAAYAVPGEHVSAGTDGRLLRARQIGQKALAHSSRSPVLPAFPSAGHDKVDSQLAKHLRPGCAIAVMTG